jgi:ligand-binding SRPBCC domain-containing protein
MRNALKTDCHIDIRRTGLLSYRIFASQVLRIGQREAFTFFEDPRNLCDITPVWLDFCMLEKECHRGVHENAEFDYTIKFLGIKMPWRSRIVDFKPPERFTDIQLKGPYKSWIHVHTLERIAEGTLVKDEVTYSLYLPALLLHRFIIRKRLIEIFRYRAAKIAEWADHIK